MHETLLFTGSVAAGFFAIMNPVGNIPIFLGLVGDLPPRAQRHAATTSVLLAFGIVTAFSVAGSFVFRVFSVSLPAFQIAGGVLVFLVGLELLHGRPSALHRPRKRDDDESAAVRTADEIAITPLAIPILAGPGTITTAMNFTVTGGSAVHTAIVVGVFAGVAALTWICFRSGERLVARIKPGVINMVTRLMGLILTVIAAQMLIDGIRRAVQQGG